MLFVILDLDLALKDVVHEQLTSLVGLEIDLDAHVGSVRLKNDKGRVIVLLVRAIVQNFYIVHGWIGSEKPLGNRSIGGGCFRVGPQAGIAPFLDAGLGEDAFQSL